MWIVVKIKKHSEISLLKSSLFQLLGKEIKYCQPKIKCNRLIKTNCISKDLFILDKYLLIHHNKFSESKTLSKLNYIRGVDHLLQGFKSCQNNIIEFVNKCEINRDKLGYLSSNFFNLSKGANIKINKGPFVNFVSEIVEIQKKKLKLLVGGMSIYLDKKENCLLPTD